eukprot:6078399-Lingulodinium_polyedra.AAC.1
MARGSELRAHSSNLIAHCSFDGHSMSRVRPKHLVAASRAHAHAPDLKARSCTQEDEAIEQSITTLCASGLDIL